MVQYNNIPLTAEERHAFTEIVAKGEYVRIRDREYLMVEISPLVRDFLNASRMKLVARGEETGPARATTPDDPELTLDQAIKLFVEDRKAGLGESSHQAYERVFKILRECLGSGKIIRDVTPQHLAGVKELILDLPRNYGVLFPGLPLWTAVERGADLPKRSTTTANNELKYVATFFEWAHAKWIIDRHPARQFMLPAHRTQSNLTRRDAFTIDDLNRILSAPLYSGCMNDGPGFARKGAQRPKRTRFWIPLIALFSGARLGEIVQLRSDDIRIIDAVPCFSIQMDGPNQGSKNEAASRRVPIHPILLDAGLLEFVSSKRTLLFDDIPGEGKRHRVSLFSQWFNARFLPSVGITSKKKCFHSFRHSFRDELRNEGVAIDIVREIGGWSRTRYGFEATYGSGVRLDVLREAVSRVNYHGLNFATLK